MKKILALDLGDAWTGIAISDALGIVARPYTTVATKEISSALADIFKKESIGTVIVGYPKTMAGNESAQTLKIVAHKEQLEKEFPAATWLLRDERLSSKRADTLRVEQGKQQKTKEDKLKGHALAAAFILDSYLMSLPRMFEDEE